MTSRQRPQRQRAHKERLAAALRENLKRRKAQAREREVLATAQGGKSVTLPEKLAVEGETSPKSRVLP